MCERTATNSISNEDVRDSFIVATRIHLGKQSSPPPQAKLISTLSAFIDTATEIGACRAVVAIDPAEKIKGYDLVRAMEEALTEIRGRDDGDDGDDCDGEEHQNNISVYVHCDLLQVSPWGNFVPALNALISYACTTKLLDGSHSKAILFMSAEMTLTRESMTRLCHHMDLEDTLVVGAALPGHDYCGNTNGDAQKVDLNGRTCPWNTLALWNLKKMKLGFPLVADGIHKMDDESPVPAGIEEFSTVLLHQKILNESKAKAKLIKVPGVEWEQTFTDEERKKWHETKMKSKLSRAEIHRDCLGGDRGYAIHI